MSRVASALEAAGIPASTSIARDISKKRAAPPVSIVTNPSSAQKKVKLSKKRTPKDFVDGKENVDDRPPNVLA